MSQYDELKRLAEASPGGPWIAENDSLHFKDDGYTRHLLDADAGHDVEDEAYYAALNFIAAANPAAVLALIAENEELGRYLCTCRDCGGEGALHTGDWHSYSPMEPPEPVMEKCGECDGTGMLGDIQDLYQVITERDQLRAEIAGLKTGYQAYEQVNAELKAEVERLKKTKSEPCDGCFMADAEALRKDAERYRWLRIDVTRGGDSDFCIVKKFWKAPSLERIITLEDADNEIDAAMGNGEQS